MIIRTALASLLASNVVLTVSGVTPFAIPIFLSNSGCIYTGIAPAKIIPPVMDLWTFLGIIILSPAPTTERIIAWIAPDVPWTEKKHASEP